jgi:hypothetical protein
VQTHEWIEHEEPRREPANSGPQAGLIASAIEAEDRDGDDVDRCAGQVEPSRAANAGEAGLYDWGGVLGHVEYDWTGVGDIEDVETGRAGRDGDGQIEGEPGFAAFRGPAKDTDGGARPQGVDEPARAGIAVVEVGGADDGERVVVRVWLHAPTPSSSRKA